MKRGVMILGLCCSVVAGGLAHAANPLETNLRALEQRAKSEKARPAVKVTVKPAPARQAVAKPSKVAVVRPAPRRAARVVRARPRTDAVAVRRVASHRSMAKLPASVGPVSYARNRIGVKARGGDLVVQAFVPDSATHVYLEQRLVSQGGNGFARVPDLSPGKYPVLVWAPDAGKRRTFWVTIRPGAVAALKASL